MKLTTRQADTVLVVEISGKWDTKSSGDVSERLAEIAEQNGEKVLLNLEKLEFLGSAGLRVILRTAKSIRAAGGELKLCSARGFTAEVLEASGFDSLLDVCESESSALEAF